MNKRFRKAGIRRIAEKNVGKINNLRMLADNLEMTNTILEEELEEQKKTIARLDESEKRCESIVQALPDIILKFDNAGMIVDCQGGIPMCFSCVDGKIIGKRIQDVVKSEIADVYLHQINDMGNSNNTRKTEYKFKHNEKDEFCEARFVRTGENEILAILRNVTEEKQRQMLIEYLSYHDQLTGLYNRRFFEEELKRLDTERNLPLTIAILDVNGLKLTNDAFGHLSGDKLLQQVADVLKIECRADDIIARIGGDEFMILLPQTTYECASNIAKRIYMSIGDKHIENIVMSVSIGWETKNSVDESIVETFLKAEEQMYRKKLTESQSMRNQTVQIILRTLTENNEIEKTHSDRVSFISRKIGEAMHLDYEMLKEIEVAGLMHDIGKISVNEQLLNKPGELTESEYDEIKKHSESGYKILKLVDAYSALADYALSHHERWDGKGYPRGLQGKEISLVARIIAVADAYEAMTSTRPYRKDALSKDQVTKELNAGAGSQFDPEIVKIFEENYEELQETYKLHEDCNVEEEKNKQKK